MRIPIILGGRKCECGAQVEAGSTKCRKCRNRARYRRRKTVHKNYE